MKATEEVRAQQRDEWDNLNIALREYIQAVVIRAYAELDIAARSRGDPERAPLTAPRKHRAKYGGSQ